MLRFNILSRTKLYLVVGVVDYADPAGSTGPLLVGDTPHVITSGARAFVLWRNIPAGVHPAIRVEDVTLHAVRGGTRITLDRFPKELLEGAEDAAN